MTLSQSTRSRTYRDRQRAKLARADAYEEALRTIANGDEPRPVGKVWRVDGRSSKNDKCIHDRWMYDDCGECIAEVARRVLATQGAPQ